jgi:hypothetical protein
MRSSLGRTGARWKVAAEVLAFACAVVVASACVAEIFQDSSCKPTTMPVFCQCPQGEELQDRCWGSTPKTGNCYGNVFCTWTANKQCDFRPQQDANPCGIVYRCDGSTCWDLCVPVGCYAFPTKPPCTGSWGYCVYP